LNKLDSTNFQTSINILKICIQNCNKHFSTLRHLLSGRGRGAHVVQLHRFGEPLCVALLRLHGGGASVAHKPSHVELGGVGKCEPDATANQRAAGEARWRHVEACWKACEPMLPCLPFLSATSQQYIYLDHIKSAQGTNYQPARGIFSHNKSALTIKQQQAKRLPRQRWGRLTV
jgi:hypothetical protein